MESLYLEPPGFLGTGASLLADLTLLAYILLIVPGMLVGYVFARRKKYRPHHRWAMTIITLVNWVLIIILMIVAYRFDIVENIAQKPTNARYLVPTIHGVLGLAAQLLGTYIIIGMWKEDRDVAAAKARGIKKYAELKQFFFPNAKRKMQIAMVLWLATSLLGVFNYLFRYDVIPTLGAGAPIPAVTPEVEAATEAAPVTTPDVETPVETESAPVETPEVEAEATQEG